MSERITAYHILRQFEQKLTRLDVLEEIEISKTAIEANERRHIKNLTSGVLRHTSILDWYSAKLYNGQFPVIK